MPANIQSGMNAKITIGATTLLPGASKFTTSGITRGSVDASEFGTDAARKSETGADPGTLSITDLIYDPFDPTQRDFVGALKNKERFYRSTETTGIRLWVSNNTFFDLPTTAGAYMFATKANDISTDRNGLAKCSVELAISGGFLEAIIEYRTDGAVAATDTTIDVTDNIEIGTPQTGTISDGTNTYAYASWTGKTFTLAAAAGHVIADDAPLRLTFA